MAKIARITPSLNTITTQSPNAIQQQTEGTGENIQAVGGIISKTGEMYRNAMSVAEKTRAQNNLDQKMNDIRTRASNDPDISDQRRKDYENEINAASAESAQFISIPQERNLFSMEASTKADISKTHVNGVFMKKAIEQGKADLDIYLNNKKDDFIKTKSPKEKMTAILERDSKIKEMVNVGFLDPGEAIKLHEKQNNDWGKSQVEYDIATDPLMAKDLLEQSKYPNIDEENRVKLLDNAKSAIRKRNKDSQDDIHLAQIASESDYLTKFASGQANWMTVEDVSSDVRQGILPEKFGAAFADVIKAQGEYEPREPANENYPEFIEKIYGAKDKTELQAGLLSLLKDHKNISVEKMSVLINEAQKRGKNLPLKINDLNPGEGQKVNVKQKEEDANALAVMIFGRKSNLSSNEISNMYQIYANGLSDGKSPMEAYGEAIKQHVISVYPPAANMENPPNLILDENSPIRVIFPRKGKNGSTKTKPAGDHQSDHQK